MAHDYRWNQLCGRYGEHRFFLGRKLDGTPGIAVADDSGKTPDLTEDGVLWLTRDTIWVSEYDSKACLSDDNTDDDWGANVDVTLVTDDGKKTKLGGANLREMKQLRQFVNLDIQLKNWRCV